MIGHGWDDDAFDRDHAEQGRKKALSEVSAIRARLGVLREELIAEFEDLKTKAENEKTKLDSPADSVHGLARKVSLGAAAISHRYFASRIQNILDGKDPTNEKTAHWKVPWHLFDVCVFAGIDPRTAKPEPWVHATEGIGKFLRWCEKGDP